MAGYNYSAPGSSYEHKAIADTGTARVLRLHPGSQSDRLVGTICALKIENALPYEAVSYVWGEAKVVDSILIEGKHLHLTENIAAGLRCLRNRGEERILWVDQVCINQSDRAERSSQVQLMHKIYRNATKVLVWLGHEDGGNANNILRFIQLSSLPNENTSPGASGSVTVSYAKMMARIPEECWASLREFYNLPWVRQALPGSF